MATEIRLEIPKDLRARIDGTILTVTGPKGELSRDIRFPQIAVTANEKEIVIATMSDRKRIVAMVGTYGAHTKNMFKGVSEGFEYTMKVVYSHFPIQLKLQGNRLEINNFLGEKKARYARIEQGVTANVKADSVVLTGINKELLGNTAANIENATRVRNRDPRVFQDGIYIVQKV